MMMGILTLLHRNTWCVQLNLCKWNVSVNLEVRCWSNATPSRVEFSTATEALRLVDTPLPMVTWQAQPPGLQGPRAAQQESLWLFRPLQEAWHRPWNQCQSLLSLFITSQQHSQKLFFFFFQAYLYREGSCNLIIFVTLHLLMPGQSAKWTPSLDKTAPPSLF